MHLAELNVRRLVAPPDDPRVVDFMNNLDRINGLGKRMPRFVWMMEGSGGPGTGNTNAKLNDDPLFVPNLTVWEDYETLSAFVYQTLHKKFIDRKAEWFEVLEDKHFVMWWILAGHMPTLDEALARLAHFRDHGETEHAFGRSYFAEKSGKS